ncbi:MAG: hypothetical protein QUS07_09700 [Methanothrix sp.]|nr:hypothetical protein [Methanothrix sp.]
MQEWHRYLDKPDHASARAAYPAGPLNACKAAPGPAHRERAVHPPALLAAPSAIAYQSHRARAARFPLAASAAGN